MTRGESRPTPGPESVDLVPPPPLEAVVTTAHQAIGALIFATVVLFLVWCHRLHGSPDCLSQRWANVDAVTAADVSRVVETWFTPERRSALSVVPLGGKGALKGSLPVELP